MTPLETWPPSDRRNKLNYGYPVASVVSRKRFKIVVPDQEWVSGDPPSGYYCQGNMNLGEVHNGLYAFGGMTTAVESNRVFHCFAGGPWFDTGDTPDLTARSNYYYDVALARIFHRRIEIGRCAWREGRPAQENRYFPPP